MSDRSDKHRLDHLGALRLGAQSSRGWSLGLPKITGSSGDGSRFGRRLGSSQEFQEYRDYRAGDDLRHLDWSVYGRHDQLVVRQFRQEVSPHLDLVLDGSRSMAAGGDAKGWAALSLAAFFCACADNGGFVHRAWHAGERLELLGTVSQTPETWRRLPFEGTRSPGDLLSVRSARWRARGVRLLVSDLMWPQDPMKALRGLAAGAVAMVVVQVLSRDEVEPAPRGFVRLEDSESGEQLDLLMDAAAVDSYRHALSRHHGLWQEACRRSGALLVRLVAEDVLDALGARRQGRGAPLLDVFELLWRHRVLQAASNA